MPRFFVDVPLGLGETVTLPAAVAQHALKALRLKDQDAITLFDGTGGEYHGRLTGTRSARCTVLIESFDPREAELPFAFTLAQGLSAGDKMDWTVEKSVELGAAAIQPLALERSVLRLSSERAARRVVHWQAIARSAAEQCGRNRVPLVRPVLKLEEWLVNRDRTDLRIVACPGAALALDGLPEPVRGGSVCLVIGPEGGLTSDEQAVLLHAGYQAVSLGPRILRTETAGAAALAMLSARWSGLCRNAKIDA